MCVDHNKLNDNHMDNASAPTSERVTANQIKPAKKTLAVKPEKIRAELNIERWPAMWQPSKSKTKATVRSFERELTFSDGNRGVAKLEVGYTQFGTVTTEDQKMFYALVKQWEDSGKPTSQVSFSDRLLARILRKSWGTNVIEAITGSLRRLRLTPFRWMKSYQRSDKPKAEYEEEVPFTLLSDLKIIKRKVDGHVTNQQGYFQFDRNLLENLRSKFTKPLLFENFLQMKTEIGQLIYTHIDLLLSDRPKYERCTKDLFRDLGLGDLQYYRHASHRKQALERALPELRGIGLSTGVLKSAIVERTKDGKDYKVVFRKGPTPKSFEDEESELEPLPSPQQIVINDYSKRNDGRNVEAEELVQHFHKIVHAVERHYPQPKEIGQALSLISQHGMERGNLCHRVCCAEGNGDEIQYPAFRRCAFLHVTSARRSRSPNTAGAKSSNRASDTRATGETDSQPRRTATCQAYS